MTKEDNKAKRKEVLKKEGLLFRILVAIGVISYRVESRNAGTYRQWYKKYKTVWYHPLTWVVFLIVLVVGLARYIFEAFGAIKEEFKEKSFYC